MNRLTKQVKMPGGWRTTLSALLIVSFLGVAAGYAETVLIVWGTSLVVLAILFVGYLLSGFARLS